MYVSEIMNVAISLLIIGVFVGSLILSIVFFVLDGKKAKKEGRRRNALILAWFITMLVLGVGVLMIIGTVYILLAIGMRGM